jgi:hypothetical protein
VHGTAVDIINTPRGIRLRMHSTSGVPGPALTSTELADIGSFLPMSHDMYDILEPTSIESLVPDYLDEVPGPRDGREWEVVLEEDPYHQFGGTRVITSPYGVRTAIPEAATAVATVESALQAYRQDWLKRRAEQLGRPLPLDPITGKPLETAVDEGGIQPTLQVVRPGGVVFDAGDLSPGFQEQEHIFRLLDPEHRGEETVTILELMPGWETYPGETYYSTRIDRFRELGFREQDLKGMGLLQPNEE